VKEMNILFVCKYNRFRSKIAESAFLELNKNPVNKAKSAGIIKGNLIERELLEQARKAGYPIKGQPRTIDIPLLKWKDMIVIVAKEIPPSIFIPNSGKKPDIRHWNVPDARSVHDHKDIARIIKMIEKNVRNLVLEMNSE
jgi:protein-tyrosine-phosphatase